MSKRLKYKKEMALSKLEHAHKSLREACLALQAIGEEGKVRQLFTCSEILNTWIIKLYFGDK